MKLNLDGLQEGLRTKWLGRSIFFSCQVDSTNVLAKELATHGAAEGTVVIAETQTCGHGQLGREWFSPKGGLWFSAVLRPKLKPAKAAGLVFMASLAVAEVLRELYGLKVETKWPNDVQVSGRKICGILTEMSTMGEKVNYVIVGVGINANFMKKAFPENLKTVATSLQDELGRKIKLEELFRALLEKLEHFHELLMREGVEPILAEWKKRASFLGCQVEVASGTERWAGLALDVENDGSLVLRLEDGTMKRVFVGDVTLRLR
jgi:BirA family biotin operon repressor/biotin-[acetyl-CoA-carboxylase] ligase